jgi:hypothetical protein
MEGVSLERTPTDETKAMDKAYSTSTPVEQKKVDPAADMIANLKK